MIFGKIDYINLLPFHIFLKSYSMNNALKKAIEHKKGVPTLINKKFQKRQIDAAFISSIKSNAKNIKTLPLGIVAKKGVKSVIVKKGVCKNDPASATSNILCKVLDIQGEVFIGDIALKRYLENPNEYIDLAEVWHKKHHLPFVFALLCTNKHHRIYKKLVQKFKNKNIKIPNYILKDYAQKRGIETKEIKKYLKLISYNIKEKEKRALKLFLKMASKLKKQNVQKAQL